MSRESAKPPDGGWGWVIVACSFCIHFCIDGVTYAFGVLAAEFVDSLGCSRQLNGWIVSAMVGVTVGGGPVASVASTKFGRRPVAIAGAAIAAAGFAASFCVTRAWMLVVTVGCITGMGMSLAYLPAVVSVNVYFERRRATAMGLAACGSGAGAFVFSPIMSSLIEAYTWRGAMLLLSGVMLQCAVLGSLLRPLAHEQLAEQPAEHAAELLEKNGGASQQSPGHPKSPNGKPSTRGRLIDLSLMRNAAFVMFCLSNTLYNVGFNVPFLYMPDRAQQAGFSRTESSLLVSVIGMASLVGRLFFGCLPDVQAVRRVGVGKLAMYNAGMIVAGLALACSFAWKSFAFMIVYCATFGLACGARVTLSSPVLVDLFGLERLASTFGMTLLFQSFGVLVGPPFAGFLYDSTASFDLAFAVCGVCVLASGLMLLPLPCVQRRQFGLRGERGAFEHS